MLVADGNPLQRAGIRFGLEAHGLIVAAEAVDAASAVAAAERTRPDICLIDLDLPGSVISAIAQIATRLPATTIVVLAEAPNPAEMITALERGASGYLLKEIGEDELARSLRAAHAGEPALPRSLVTHLIDHVRRGPRGRMSRGGRVALTPREWDVAGLVQAGLPTDEIAAQLGLSPITVRRHISSLLRKSGVTRRSELPEALKTFGR